MREELVRRRRDVDRREAEGAAALLPSDDRAGHGVGAAEQRLRRDEVALAQRLSDPGRADDRAAKRDRLDDRHRERVALPKGPQCGDRALAPVAELEVGTDHDPLDVPGGGHALDEILGGLLRERLVEGEDDDVLRAGVVEQDRALRRVRERRLRRVLRQDLGR